MPDSLDGAVSQNERWEAGRLKVAVHYVPRLLRAARVGAHGSRWTYVDAAIDISLPPLTTAVAIPAIGGLGLVAAARGRVRRIGVAASALAVGLQVAHVLHSLHLADAPPEVLVFLQGVDAGRIGECGFGVRGDALGERLQAVRLAAQARQDSRQDRLGELVGGQANCGSECRLHVHMLETKNGGARAGT